ncbi:MAG: hypothetical protein ACYS14_11465, partial [Planctomycetota bacterium]
MKRSPGRHDTWGAIQSYLNEMCLAGGSAIGLEQIRSGEDLGGSGVKFCFRACLEGRFGAGQNYEFAQIPL